MNEVPNNEQITDEPRFFQNFQLIIKPPNQLRVAPSPFTIALPQPIITKLAQIVFARFPSRSWIFGYLERPNSRSRWQRSPISSVFSIACGKSRNTSRISSGDLKYNSGT